jgi:flagellar protein FliO/FliZ
MIKSFPFSRTAVRAVTLVLGALASAPASARAFTPAPVAHRSSAESTPLNLTPSHVGTHTSTSGPSIVRTIVGLLIVIAVIWGLSWILRQVKSGRESRSAGEGLRSLATLPLGSGRSLHLVRAGADYLLVGSAEHGVAPIHRYTEQEARAAGLIDDGDASEEEPGATPRSGRAIQIPGQSSGLLERLREWTVRR